MKFYKVKIDPTVTEVLNPVEIKGLLARHKGVYEQRDWKSTYSATVSDLGSVKYPGCFFHVLTVFLEEGDVTFVTLVLKGQKPPDATATMDVATGDFDWNATDTHGRPADWRPEFN
jgi:hypothetical protein